MKVRVIFSSVDFPNSVRYLSACNIANIAQLHDIDLNGNIFSLTMMEFIEICGKLVLLEYGSQPMFCGIDAITDNYSIDNNY